MKKMLVSLVFVAFLIPSVSSAAPLSLSQANAIIALLYAFNVEQATIDIVWQSIKPADAPVIQTQDMGATVAPQVVQTTPEPQVVVKPKFVGKPSVSRNYGTGDVTFTWNSDVASSAKWYLCPTRNECILNYDAPSDTSHSFTIERPANAVEFYKIELENGDSYSAQIPQ